MHLLKSLLAAAVITVSGCASQIPPPEYTGLEKSNHIAIHDLRPRSESEKEIFSLLVTSDAYAIYRAADDATKPTGVRLLAHRAYETLPALSSQPSITVRHFVSYANLQSRLRTTSLLTALTGPLGVVLLTPKDLPVSDVKTAAIDSAVLDNSAGDKEYTRAFFTAQENPEKAPVNVVYIDTEMLGKRITSRCLVPPVAGKPNLFLIEAFDMCITNHLALYRGQGATSTAQ